jgi:tetratricopeptide (TPR) repeat protein
VDHIKLFRNLPQLRFEGRIHEQILPAIRQLGGVVGWTDIYVTHSGSDQSPEGKRRKYERDLRILQLDLQDRPEHPFVLFNLGMTYADMDDYGQAANYLERCLAVSAPSESHVRKAYALLVQSYANSDQVPKAWETCQTARRVFNKDPELLFRHAMLAHEQGQLEEAERAYLAVLKNNDDRHFSSVDAGIVGYKARHNLAVVYTDMGRHDLAETQWRLILDEKPTYPSARRGLAQSLLRQNRYVSAELTIERSEGLPPAEVALLKGELAEGKGQLDLARRILSTALTEHPDDVSLEQHWCRFLFDHGGPDEAEHALRALVSLQPEDGAAHHNLGLILLRVGQVESAAESFRKSLRLRPQ